LAVFLTHANSVALSGHTGGDFGVARSAVSQCGTLAVSSRKKLLKKHGEISSFYLFVQKKAEEIGWVCHWKRIKSLN